MKDISIFSSTERTLPDRDKLAYSQDIVFSPPLLSPQSHD